MTDHSNAGPTGAQRTTASAQLSTGEPESPRTGTTAHASSLRAWLGSAEGSQAAPLLLGALIIVALGVNASLALPANQDNAWTLMVAARVLDGAQMYRDIIEVHPPLVFWFSVAVEWLARAIGLAGLVLFNVIVGALAVLGVGVAYGVSRRPMVPVLLAFLLLVFVGFDFGQGEHLFLAFFAPYVLLLERRLNGRPLSVPRAAAIGLLAGLAVSIKPFFVVVWMALEAMWIFALRRSADVRDGNRGLVRSLVRPESVALVATGVVYICAVLILAPGYLRVATWAARAYGSFHPSTPADVVLSWRMAVAVAFLIVAPFLYRRGNRLAGLSAAAVAAFTATVLLQNKGWPYHWYPAIGLVVLTLGLLVPYRRSLTAALVVAAVFVGPNTAERWWSNMTAWPYYLPETMRAVEQYGGPVTALSTVMQSTFPLVNYAEVEYASRFATLWPLPAFYERGGQPFPYNAPERMEPLERYMFEAVIEDLETMNPALIIVDRMPPRGNPPERALAGFSYLEYFGQDPRFRELISDYALVQELGPWLLLARRDRIAELAAIDPGG